jgi:hypothetical protein
MVFIQVNSLETQADFHYFLEKMCREVMNKLEKVLLYKAPV